ncbi:hypothetical protein [Rhizobium sp. MHM7A]|uniref:RCC1 domain-containing protein n=1 Tax=Rhizobium sp. MHM7A TaxID=2583233 RepID=UPI001106FBF5|nr:hypothetical protein [Rhizobium sp. MHM7A]TLX15763.1 hypothetical protein FFR93_00145 [Rhizobium sp. MHM7A]
MKRSLRTRTAAVTALILAQIAMPFSIARAQEAQFYYRHNQQLITQGGNGGPVDPNAPEFIAINLNGDSEILFEVTTLPSLGIQLRRQGSSALYTNGATWTLASGQLPPGVTADIADDGSSLIYAGYPTATGTYGNITWKVTGADGKQVTTQPQTIIVNPRTPLLLTSTPATSRTLLAGTDDANLTVKASNIAYNDNLAPSNWSVSGQLPAGVSYSINGNEVHFSGISTQTGTFSNIIVSATDNANGSATTTLTFNVTNQTSSILAANVGDNDQILTQYTSQPILGTAIRDVTSNAAYTEGASWTLASGTLPPGIQPSIAANGSTMTYTGYPTEIGTWSNITWLVEAANGSQVQTNPISFTVEPRLPLTLAATPSATRNLITLQDDANLQVTASNVALGTPIPAENWTITGQLPPGITYSTGVNSLKFSGTADEGGSFSNIVVSATDTLGATASTTIGFDVTANPAPFVAVNVYGSDITLGKLTTKPENGTAIRDHANATYHGGVTWELVSGTLPPGITYSNVADGSYLSYGGYATEIGTWSNIVWEVSDAQGNKIRTKPVSFTVTERSPLTLVASPSPTRVMNSFTDDAYVTVKATNSLYGNAIESANWSITGDLPPGVGYTFKNGGIAFTGKATQTGTYATTINATDSDGTVGTVTVTFEVTTSPPPYIAANVYGSDITLARFTDKANNGTAIRDAQSNTPYTSSVKWELVSGTLPPGIEAVIDEEHGQWLNYTGYPTEIGTWNNIVWAVSDNTGHVVFTTPVSFDITERKTLTLAATPSDKQVLAANVDDVNTTIVASNVPYATPITADNWTITGLPTGISATKTGNTVTLTGKPTTTGIYNIVATATDSLGSTASETVTVEVYTNTNSFKQVALGQHHTCGLTLAGGVKCWGLNGDGQLGDGTTVNKTVPVDVVGLQSGVKYISSGHQHSCAILNTGVVKCWGQQADGRLGNGLTASAKLSTPVTATEAGSDLMQISAGAYHTCGVTNAGAAVCFGLNTYGGIGDNTTITRANGTTPDGMGSGVSMINVGSYTTCAAKTDGSAWCWGLGSFGQIGDGFKLNRLLPVQALPAGSGVTKVETRGYLATHGTSCALTSSGAKCWGRNNSGQVGIGNTVDQVSPMPVTDMGDATDIAVAIEHSCAVKSDRSLYCWGRNSNGRIGDGTWINKSVPTATLIGKVTGITAGGDSACAPTPDGVFCWGGNTYGALGNGNTTAQNTPVPLTY